jgi:hypothetical protein
MTENGAIREVRFNMSTIGLSDKAAKRVVEARNMAIKALEKQMPKKPTYEGDGYAPDGTLVYDTWICPCCDKRYEVYYDDYDYCPNCGQKLDWSEEGEENNGVD